MLFQVFVHPRASRRRVRWDGATLELWVTAPAVDGAANRAVVEALSDWLGVRAGAVHIMSGQRSRSKRVEVDGISRPPPAPVQS